MKKIYFALLACLLSLNFNAQIGLSFNGTNSVTSNGTPVLNNQSRTVDAWIKTTSTITTQMVIADWGVITPNGSRFTLNVINNRLRIEVGGFGITGNIFVNTGQWVHVTAVYESSITAGNNVFLYVNGVLDVSGVFTGYSTLTTANTVGFRLGTRVDGINFFVGAMDEVKVYNYARSQAQVAADTVEYCGPQPGLVLYYKLNEGIANATNTGSTTCIDYSGFNNNGTLSTNFALTGTVSNWVPGRVRPNAPIINTSAGNSICTGASINLSAAAAPGTYTWSTGNTTNTIITVSPTTNTVYSIAVTTTQNCVSTSSIAITVVSSAPVVTVTTLQNPICFGASTSFSASGASSYAWSGGLINGQAFSPTVTTSYTLIATNACGVVNSVHTITVNPVPIQITSSTNSVCEGSAATLTATSVMTNYTWMPTGVTGSIALVSPSIATIYTVTATNGTCIGTQTILLNTLPSPSVSIAGSTVNPTSAFICSGNSYTATATSSNASLSYTWFPTGGNNATGVLTPSVSSVFTVVGTANNGCSGLTTIVLVVQPSPSVSIVSNKPFVCPGGTTTLVASGVGTKTWSTGSTAPSITVSPTAPFSVYSVTITSTSNSCTTVNSYSVSVFTPSVTYSSSVTACYNTSTTLTASGADTYSWNGVYTGTLGSIVITPTANGTYTLATNSFSQQQNCPGTYIATVNVIPSPTITVSGKTITCKHETPVTLTAFGANSYTWVNTGTTGNTLSPTPQTTTQYTVIGTAANLCTAAATFTLRIVVCPGFQEITPNSTLAVFPVPACNYITISSSISTTINLFSIESKLVESFEVKEGESIFSVEHLPRGIYFMTYTVNQQPQHLKLYIE